MTKIVASGKLTAKRMQGIIEAVRAEWNFFVPAFPDGRTPAEAAGVKAQSWMQPLLTTYKERLDKLAVGIHPVDRYSEIVGDILSELARGLSTPRTEAVTKIMEGLEKYGPAEQSSRKTPGRPRTSTKRRSSLEEPLERPRMIVPFASLYTVTNVKKAQRKLRQHSRVSDAEARGYNVEEGPRGEEFVAESWGNSSGSRFQKLVELPTFAA